MKKNDLKLKTWNFGIFSDEINETKILLSRINFYAVGIENF